MAPYLPSGKSIVLNLPLYSEVKNDSMKNILILIFICIQTILTAQNKVIILNDCIKDALINRINIKEANVAAAIAKLQTDEAISRFSPQISIAYDYRFNPIIPSQIVPVGQFNPIPNNETRAIQFGTKWQQNIGLSLYQPLLDFSIKSKISESKINETIKSLRLESEEELVINQVLKSFSNISVLSANLASFVKDTQRTALSMKLANDKYEEGKAFKVDVNKSKLLHNNAISALNQTVSQIIREKIFLAYLTARPLSYYIENTFDFESLNTLNKISNAGFKMDSLTAVRELVWNDVLLDQKIISEKQKYIPTIGLQGYLGANQYSNNLNPFLKDSWFGNSYVGLNIKIPVLLGENPMKKIAQYETEMQINQLENTALYEENISIVQERLQAGLTNLNELNNLELELQKESLNKVKLDSELRLKEIELLCVKGYAGLIKKGLK